MTSAVHIAEVADILAELGSEIESLGAALCLDAGIVSRHVSTLQAIDLIAQKQRLLADLLRADCPRSFAAAMGLDELKDRLVSIGVPPDQVN